MKRILWIGIFLAVVSIVLAFFSAFHDSSHSSIPKIESIVPVFDPPQANKSTAFQSPFYYPFKEKHTHMNVMNPFTQDFRYFTKTNSQGFRTVEYTFAHPPKTFRIVVLGDIYTWGSGVTMEETYPYLMATSLNSECSNVRYEIISMGIPGHRFVDQLIKLLVHAQYTNPDLIVVQLRPEDVELYNYASILQRQGKSLADITQKQTDALAHNSIDRHVFSEALQEMKKWSAQHSIPITFLAFPLIDTDRSGKNFDRYQETAMSAMPRMKLFEDVLTETRAAGPTLYLLETFRKEAGDQYLAVSGSGGGLNSFAHFIVASALNKFLSANHLIQCSQSQLKPPDANWEKESKIRTLADHQWKIYNSSFSEQAKFYESLINLYPENPWIMNQLSEIYIRLNRRQEAYAGYESLKKSIPQYASPGLQMANTTKDFKTRIMLLEETRQILPDHVAVLLSLARLYLSQSYMRKEGCQLLAQLKDLPMSDQQFEASTSLSSQHDCAAFQAH